MRDGTRVGAVIAAFFAASAVGAAYYPLWLADHALNPAEIGLVLGMAAFLRIAAVPGAGWIADQVGPRGVLAAAAAVSATAALSLPWLHGLAPLLVATVLMGCGGAMLAPVADAVTLALAAARRLDYGRTRAWGSISYMVATASGGALLARAGTLVVPVLLTAAYTITAGLVVLMPRTGTAARNAAAGENPLRGAAFRWTLLATACIQGSHAAYYGFAPLLWRAAGIGDTAIGLLIAEGIVAEIALFLWGRTLIERLGPVRLATLAAGACIVRWTGLALTTSVPVLAGLQPLHAATFAFQHLSSMMVLRGLPARRAATAQAVLSALGFSLPTGVLVWTSGLLVRSGGTSVFLVMAGVGGSALLAIPGMRRAVDAPP